MPLGEIERAFAKGTLKPAIKLTNGQSTHPPAGKKWLILYGFISHSTGNNTVMSIQQGLQGGIISANKTWVTYIDTAVGSGEFSLFNNNANGSAPQLLIINDTQKIVFSATGGVDWVTFVVLEWE